MIRRLLFLFFFVALNVAAQNSYTTNFPAAENPISESGRWINGHVTGLDWNDVQTTPNFASGVNNIAGNTNDPTAVLTGIWGANQFARGTVFASSANSFLFPEVELRLNTTITAHSITGYEFTCSVLNHPPPGLAIVRWNGPVNNFTFLVTSPTLCRNGDLLTASNVGGVIKAYINGVLILTATDTTYSGGSPGIGFNANAGGGATYTNFGFSSFSASDTTPLWDGIIEPVRAMDWTTAGIPGGLPDASWPICTTISAYTGNASAINSALVSCHAANPTGGVVALGAGTFTLSIGIIYPVDTIGHLALRGAGAKATQPNFSGSSFGVCNGQSGFICANSSDGTLRGAGGTPHVAGWTAGYAQGAMQITLSSIATIIPNKALLILNQCDTDFSGPSCLAGSALDNNAYFECATSWSAPGVGCSAANQGFDGQSWRVNRASWQQEIVQVTAINQGGCGVLCVTISQPPLSWTIYQAPATPKSGPHISSVSFLTPFFQLVEYSDRAPAPR